MTRFALLTILILGFLKLHAQSPNITIIPQDTEDFTVEKIVNRLISGGLKVLNIKSNFTESDLAMGYFHDKSRYMGMEQGMILSTGAVFELVGENLTDNHTSMAYQDEDNSGTVILSNKPKEKPTEEWIDSEVIFHKAVNCDESSGDADLSKEIAGLVTYDARVIELQFKATADTFYYRYVFASEEYDEYVCSTFNDVFAFYLIDNETDIKVNTAIIPNKKLPVSINTINAGNPADPGCPKSNSYLYQRNNGKQGLIFDGFTKVLDIRQKVTQGKTYTIKIAVADASDCIWDSAVLIENNSIFSYFKCFEMNFMTNSANPMLPEKLDEIVRFIKSHPNCRIQLIGHSDRVGSIAHNYGLSVARTIAIREMLLSNGIDASRIIETYKGESMPRYEHNAKNRRVEIFVMGE